MQRYGHFKLKLYASWNDSEWHIRFVYLLYNQGLGMFRLRLFYPMNRALRE